MVTEPLTVETVETSAPAPEAPAEETEAPAEEAESAAPEQEPAAELQVEAVEPEKPDYITREQFERELSAERQKAAQEALELDRRRRQTENARKAAAEQRQAEERVEARDTIKAAFGAAGVYEVPDETIFNAIDRVARKQAQFLANDNADLVERTARYIAAPITGDDVEYDEAMLPIGQKLSPVIQNMLDKARSQIETTALDNYKKSDAWKKDVDAEVARRGALKREGTEELKRPSATPTNANTQSIEYWDTRVAHEGEDGYPPMTSQDWATYMAIRRREGL